MKETTEAYRSGMEQSFRRRSRLRVVLDAEPEPYVFEDDVIISASRTEDVDPISRRLPTETFSFSAADFAGEYNPANPEGKWLAIDENARIGVQFGFDTADGTEWLSADTYYLDGRPAVSAGVATFSASSILSRMTKRYYKARMGNRTLRQLAESIFSDSGIPMTGYSIDTALGGIETTGVLPIDTAANLLQTIAHAGGCALYTRDGVVTMKRINTEAMQYDDLVLTKRSIALGGDEVSKTEPLYKVQAYRYTYRAGSEATVLYQATVDVEGEVSYHCEFEAANDTAITVSEGATISGEQHYARAIDCTIEGSGTFTVTVTGKKLSVTYDIAESLAGADEGGGTDTENNPLITTETARNELIYRSVQYLSRRLTHTVAYRGNTEIEALDGLYFASVGGGYTAALVLASTIEYNGAVSGTLILKSVTEGAGTDAALIDADGEHVNDETGQPVLVIGAEPYESDYTAEEMDDFCGEVIGR